MAELDLLDEYVDWRERLTAFPTVDTSVEAFRQWRTDVHNRARIAEALQLTDNCIRTWNDHGTETPAAIEALRQIQHALENDRPYITESTITGPQRRIYT